MSNKIDGGAPTLLAPGKLRVVAKSGFKETKAQLDSYPSAGEYILEKIKELINVGERTLILESDTGSGKSTYLTNQIRKNISTIYPDGKDKYILVAQPRVLTAVEIPLGMARDTTNYPDLQFGRNIGYSTGAFKNPSQRGGLLYTTVGVPLAQIQANEDQFICDRYSFIIIDEAHEKDKELIILLYMLRDFLERNKKKSDCPFVIFMSATLDIYKFADYFNTDKIISVKGLTFPIKDHYPTTATDNYILRAAETVMELSQKPDDPINRDILVFLPGEKEIKDVRLLLEEMDTKDELVVLKITGKDVRSQTMDTRMLTEMTISEIRKYLKRPNINRRVALSTNIAETGITIDTLKYVIDSGWTRAPEYNPIHDLVMVITKGAPRNSIKQRKGRAGRKFEGDFYPLYTKETHENLPAESLSPIYTTNNDLILLNLFNYQDTRKKKIEIPKTIDPLGTENVLRSIDKLRVLGMLDNTTYEPSRMGKMGLAISRLQNIETIKMVLASYLFRISLRDILNVALFVDARPSEVLDTRSRPGFRITDILDKLNINIDSSYLNAIMADEFIRWWFICKYYHVLLKKHKTNLNKVRTDMEKMHINFDGFISIYANRRTILEDMDTFGMKDIFPLLEIKDINEDLTNVMARFKGCIYEGFKLNYATLVQSSDNSSDSYYESRTGVQFNHFIYTATDTKPKTILFDRLSVLNMPRAGKYNYQYSAGQISVLDGYLAICVK